MCFSLQLLLDRFTDEDEAYKVDTLQTLMKNADPVGVVEWRSNCNMKPGLMARPDFERYGRSQLHWQAILSVWLLTKMASLKRETIFEAFLHCVHGEFHSD